MADELIGPILNPGSPRTELAPAILELVKSALLQDPAYVERIKRHYRLFRQKIDDTPPSRPRIKYRKRR
jgi:hypothetical protein